METSSVCHGYAFGESKAIDVIDLSLAVPLVSNMDLETNSTQLEPDSVAYMHLGRREVGLSCSFARFARFAIVFCYCFWRRFWIRCIGFQVVYQRLHWPTKRCADLTSSFLELASRLTVKGRLYASDGS